MSLHTRRPKILFQTHLFLLFQFTGQICSINFFFNQVQLFIFWGSKWTDLTSQTTAFGNKCICSSTHPPVLNIQWNGNNKIHRHTARCCFGSIGSLQWFLCLLRCGPDSANKSSNCLTDIRKYVWNRLWYNFNSRIKLWTSPFIVGIFQFSKWARRKQRMSLGVPPPFFLPEECIEFMLVWTCVRLLSSALLSL